MLRKITLILGIILTFTLSSSLTHAQAWNQPQNNEWQQPQDQQNQWDQPQNNQWQQPQNQNQWEQPQASTPHTSITVTDRVLQGNLKNFGINIGARDQFGAAQYLKNVIPNPGFESAELATLFPASWGASAGRVQADNWDLSWNNQPWMIGQPVKYWDGAQYEILSGPAKGRTGTVTKFTHEDGRPTYYLSGTGRSPHGGDIIAVRHQRGGFFQKRPNGYNTHAPSDTRPGSPGTQSLHLIPSQRYDASLIIPLDSMDRDGDGTAGKMMKVQGNWHFEIWAKAGRPNDKIEVQFRRIGEQVFHRETININNNWQRISRNFYVDNFADSAATANVGPVVLEIRIPPGGGGAWVDDAVLQRNDYKNPTVFTDTFVGRLQELEPGILRDWGEQLGSSLDNQLAVPHARKTTGHSPLSQNPANYHYSLPEFLKLAQTVGSEPWYVIPPTFSKDDLSNLIAYLGAPAGTHPYADIRVAQGQHQPWTAVFETIHLEYGNEMWGSNAGNDPFIGATARGGINLGQISHERIGIMKASPYFRGDKFNMVVGGQVNVPRTQNDIMQNASNQDSIALSPYYGKLDVWQTDEDMFLPTFAQATQNVRNGQLAQSRRQVTNYKRGTDVSIYEINLHTTFGNAPIDIRNEYVTSLGNGLALPLHMLTYQRDLGIRDQAAFTALQYSVKMPDNSGHVRLWGLLRDLEVTGRKRPGWLGLELANTAILNQAVQTTQSGKNPSWVQKPINGIFSPTEVDYIQSFSFKEGNQRSLVLFNLNLTGSEAVKINIPGAANGGKPATMYTLKGGSIRADNETQQQVYVQTQNLSLWQGYDLSLPPHSMTVISWEQ